MLVFMPGFHLELGLLCDPIDLAKLVIYSSGSPILFGGVSSFGDFLGLVRNFLPFPANSPWSSIVERIVDKSTAVLQNDGRCHPSLQPRGKSQAMQRLFLILAVVFLGCLVIHGNLNAQDAAYYTNRGIDRFQEGEYGKAIDDYTEAIRLNPNYPMAYNNRGIAWAAKGDHDKAIADFDKALLADKPPVGVGFFDKVLGVKSRNASTYFNRGIAWNNKGEYGKAVADYTETIRRDPTMVLAYNAVAWLYATCPDEKLRDGKKAVENATRAHQLSGGRSWIYIATFAAAYAESGDFEKAKEWQAKAIELAATDKSVGAKEKADAASRLELYKQRKPYRDELNRKP